MGHVVSKSVIVHMFFVLVRPNYIIDMVFLFFFIPLETASPELCGVKYDFIAVFVHKVLIGGDGVILVNSISNVCCNMLFDETRPNFCLFSCYDINSSPNWGDFTVSWPGCFPRIHGTFKPVILSLSPCSLKSSIAID